MHAYLRLRKRAAMRAAARKPLAFAGLNAAPVTVRGEGRDLSCLLAPGEPGRGVWLLAHGLGENRWQMASRAAWFRSRGHSVLLLDFRSHGQSDWGPVSFGRSEAADVDAAVGYLETRFPGEPISFCGVSLGAAAGVLAASAERFDRVILELLYRALEDAVMDRARAWLTRASFPVARAYLRRLEHAYPGGDPLEAVTRLRGRVLLLAGALDPYVPLAHARQLAAAAGAALVEFPRTGHRNLHRVARAEWQRAVQDWLDGPSEQAAAVLRSS